MEKLMLTTKDLIDVAKMCVNAKSVEECDICPLSDNMECQNYLIKELAERLDIRLQRRMIEAHPENYIKLPCPMGTRIFMIVSRRHRLDLPYFDWIKETKLTYGNLEKVLEQWGERVFLTKEEAEKKIKSYFKAK